MRIEHIRASDKSGLSGYITNMDEDGLAVMGRALRKVLGIKTGSATA